MSELGRGFDPTIDEDAARRRTPAPGIDAPTPMTAPEADLPVAPANVPHDAVAREAPEPASRPPSTDTQAMQGLPSAPAPVEPSVAAAASVKATGIVGGDPQADRADAEAEAKYHDAVLSAIAVERMVDDAATSDQVYEISRYFKTDAETVRERFKFFQKYYWTRRAKELPLSVQLMLRENPELTRDVLRDQEKFEQFKSIVNGFDGGKPKDGPGTAIIKDIKHIAMGVNRAHLGMQADAKTFEAVGEKAQAQQDLANIEAFKERKYRHQGGLLDLSRRMRDYMGGDPARRQEIEDEARLVASRKIEDSPTYIEGRKLEAQRKDGVEKEYATANDLGDATGRLVIGGIATALVVGAPMVIRSESGKQVQEAIDKTRDAPLPLETGEGNQSATFLLPSASTHEGERFDRIVKVKDRNTLLQTVLALPITKPITWIPGVKQTVQRIETFVGPNGTFGLRVLGGGVEGGASGGLETVVQNVIARDLFDPSKETSDGVLQAIVLGGAVGMGGAALKGGDGGAHATSKQILSPIEVQTLRARASAKLADNLEEAVKIAQRGLSISRDPASLAKYIDEAVPDRSLFISTDRLYRLVQQGKLTPENIKQLGIEDQIVKLEGGSGDVTISLRQLMKSKIAPEHIGELARSVKFDAKMDSGYDAAVFLKQRDGTLDDLARRMKSADPETDDGAFIFTHATRQLREDGSLSDKEIERQAARLAERFLDDAREGKSSGAKFGADFLYYQKISRTDPVDRNLPEDVALQKQLEAFRSMRQGIGWPDGAARKPSADKPPAISPPTDRARLPASPGWSDYPTTIPLAPVVE